jgi:hypothetical protein
VVLVTVVVGDDWMDENMTEDDRALYDYREGYIDYDDLPYHLREQLRDDYLWAQADAIYDAMQEEDI